MANHGWMILETLENGISLIPSPRKRLNSISANSGVPVNYEFIRSFPPCSRVYRFIAPLILPTRGPISRPISDLSSSVCACVNNGQFRSIRVISFHPPLTLFHLLTVMGIVFHTLTDPTDSRSRRKRPADSDPSPPWPTLS